MAATGMAATGMAAISPPAGLGTDGVPIGVQLHGSFAREDLLLQVAAQIERARPDWSGATPPVHVTRIPAGQED